MILSIADSVTKAYPNLRIAVVMASGISNRGVSEELLEASSKQWADSFARSHSVNNGWSTHPNVLAWRNTYRSFGFNPKKHEPTTERLFDRVMDGKGVPWISKVVTSYLLAELEFLLPVGGYDLDRVAHGEVVLRHSAGGEEFIPLDAASGDVPKKTKPGEVIYGDSE